MEFDLIGEKKNGEVSKRDFWLDCAHENRTIAGTPVVLTFLYVEPDDVRLSDYVAYAFI
jgi:hypothetical protein